MTDRVAVVTGGLAGIGHAIAAALASQGVRIAVGARRGGDDALRQHMRDTVGPEAFVDTLDVCDEASVSTFFHNVKQALGPVDILVNAAGVSLHQKTSDHSLDDWRAVLDTNLTGPFLATRAVLPEMISRGWGRIVNIGSTAVRTAQPDYPAYCASKAGLLGLTRAVALEGAPHGVSCIMVSPTW
ncbi:MAG: SDR family NAD(P)-dependent oxidoreductase, partial [Pseudomonadota bacterium]